MSRRSGGPRRHGRGFTLVEVLLALGLATMVYALVAYTTLQLNRTARAASRAAEARAEIVQAVEQFRWQVRCLFLPREASETAPRPTGNFTPASMIGRRTQEEDREILLFRTTRLKNRAGATEVGYRILTSEEDGEPYLAFREFPYADAAGLHPVDEDPEGPWKVLTREIVGLRLEFSADGETWQREWDVQEPPQRVKATFTTRGGSSLTADVSPGIEAPRW